MRYLCLVYLDEAKMVSIAKDPAAIEAIDAAAAEDDRELRDKGQLIMASALLRVREAVTVRVRDGRISATDGPFAETKEQIGGFILIEARDLNEAIAIAAKTPLAKVGSIEVRPLGFPDWAADAAAGR